MKYLIKITAIIICAQLNWSCSNQAKNKLDKLLQYTGTNFQGYCKIGDVNGEASMRFINNELEVRYTVSTWANNFVPQSYTEKGTLKNLVLNRAGSYYTMTISGDWDCLESGNGKFRIEVLGPDSPNQIYISITGANFTYYVYQELSTQTFNDIIVLLEGIPEGETDPKKESIVEKNTPQISPSKDKDTIYYSYSRQFKPYRIQIDYHVGTRKLLGELVEPNISQCHVTSEVSINFNFVIDRDGNVIQTAIKSGTYNKCEKDKIMESVKDLKFSKFQRSSLGWIKLTLTPE